MPQTVIAVDDALCARVAELVAQLTPIPDMATLLGLTEYELRTALDETESPLAQTYKKARAEVALRFRQRDIDLAEAGSPTAAAEVGAHFLRMLQSE